MHMGKGTPLSDRPLQVGQLDEVHPPMPPDMPVFGWESKEELKLTAEQRMRIAQGQESFP